MTSWSGYPPPAPPRPPTPWYRNVWVWVSVYGVFAVAGSVAAFVLFFGSFFEDWDGGYYEIDQESVNQAVWEPCEAMTRAGQDIKVFSSPAEGADALHRFVVVGREIPATIDTIDNPDGSTKHWRDDWVTLLDALDSYADELAVDPDAEFVPPEGQDGDSLMYDMSWVSDVPCELPPAIVALDPEASAGVY